MAKLGGGGVGIHNQSSYDNENKCDFKRVKRGQLSGVSSISDFGKGGGWKHKYFY